MLRDLHVAFGFLTTLPLPPGPGWEPSELRRAVRAFPLVGLVLGAVLALAALVFGRLGLPGMLTGALLLALWLLLTGALHFDGFCDLADAALASRSPAERQQIAKDPHLGTFALAAGGSLLLVKAAALAAAPHWSVLLVIPTLGRTLVIWPLRASASASSSDLGRSARPTRRDALLTLLLGFFLAAACAALWLTPAAYLWILGSGAGGTLLLAGWLRRRLEGLGGDAYGALIETAEALMLIAAVAVA